MNERLLRAGEVAEALNVSPETVLRWTRRGELPAASPDRSTRPRPRQPHRRECTIRRDYVKSYRRPPGCLPSGRAGAGSRGSRLPTDYRQHYRRGERIDISASAPRAWRRALWLAFIDCSRCLSDGSNLVHDPRYPTRISVEVPRVLPYPSARRELQQARPRPAGRPARPTG